MSIRPVKFCDRCDAQLKDDKTVSFSAATGRPHSTECGEPMPYAIFTDIHFCVKCAGLILKSFVPHPDNPREAVFQNVAVWLEGIKKK